MDQNVLQVPPDITVTEFSSDNIDLTLDEKVTAKKAKSYWTNFKLAKLSPPLTASEKLNFVLTPYSGDPDMYIGLSGFPSEGINPVSWKDRRVGIGFISISTTSANYSVNNVYYISVRAYTDVMFSILAYKSSGTSNKYKLLFILLLNYCM